jgi:hypothetical protein
MPPLSQSQVTGDGFVRQRRQKKKPVEGRFSVFQAGRHPRRMRVFCSEMVVWMCGADRILIAESR